MVCGSEAKDFEIQKAQEAIPQESLQAQGEHYEVPYYRRGHAHTQASLQLEGLHS